MTGLHAARSPFRYVLALRQDTNPDKKIIGRQRVKLQNTKNLVVHTESYDSSKGNTFLFSIFCYIIFNVKGRISLFRSCSALTQPYPSMGPISGYNSRALVSQFHPGQSDESAPCTMQSHTVRCPIQLAPTISLCLLCFTATVPVLSPMSLSLIVGLLGAPRFRDLGRVDSIYMAPS